LKDFCTDQTIDTGNRITIYKLYLYFIRSILCTCTHEGQDLLVADLERSEKKFQVAGLTPKIICWHKWQKIF